MPGSKGVPGARGPPGEAVSVSLLNQGTDSYSGCMCVCCVCRVCLEVREFLVSLVKMAEKEGM